MLPLGLLTHTGEESELMRVKEYIIREGIHWICTFIAWFQTGSSGSCRQKKHFQICKMFTEQVKGLGRVNFSMSNYNKYLEFTVYFHELKILKVTLT